MNKLNSLSYAYHYRSLDSTQFYAHKALQLSVSLYDGDGMAEALNNLAFVSLSRMCYDEARQQLDSIPDITDNQIELLVSYVQQMRLCQRRSNNREFYSYRERARHALARIEEERSLLDERQQSRLLYAESELSIVESTYFYYVGLERQSVSALQSVPNEIEADTAQWLNYLYNVGAGGIVSAKTQEEVDQMEFDYLMRCYLMALQADYPYFVANSLEALAEHLAVPGSRERLMADNLPSMKFFSESSSVLLTPEQLPIYLAERSLMLFQDFGDIYQIAGAYRTLATCYRSQGDYEAALYYLEQALSDSTIHQAPDLIASIREQLSVAYAAINDKTMSDQNRNLYLDLQEQTRQDRSLEARADQLEQTVSQMNLLLLAVVIVIVLLSLLLALFNHMYRRHKAAAQVDVREQLAVHRLHLENARRLNLEQRAKVSFMVSITPFIDRMLHETRDIQPGGREYIRELAEKINEQNDILTDWIQLRKGELNLHIESFRLQLLFDILVKSKTGFAMKGIDLKVLPTTAIVKADRVLTLFMLNTLADNARKFTEAGGIVEVKATETDKYVEISVSDTGAGMDDEQLSHIFEHKVISDDKRQKSHGFGLINCKGIIDKYRKTSQIFSVALLSAESKVGEGSRFFFRLPKGVMRLLLPFFLLISSNLSIQASNHVSKAKAYADSAYFSNINRDHLHTLLFVDSCRHQLNEYYRELTNGTDTMTLMGDPSVMANEIIWFHDSLAINYSIILDMRNEAAVAALALHEWGLYTYNNRIYTQLFKEISADSSLDDYVRTMQRSQTDKSIAIALLLLVLLSIIPAHYFLYYRRRQMLDDVEQMTDELHCIEMEEDALHVSNAVLENCLSTLKHETMYFPSRISQLVDRNEVGALLEIAEYYRELYGILSLQAMRQVEGAKLHLEPLHHEILGDRTLVNYLFDILRQQAGEKQLNIDYQPYDGYFVEVRVSMPKLKMSEIEVTQLFEPHRDHIPFLLCRQIVREHGEAIHRTDFGIKAEIEDNHVTIILKLPRQICRNNSK